MRRSVSAPRLSNGMPNSRRQRNACLRPVRSASYRNSAAGVTPMTFSFPITGADCVSLPSQIEKVQLFEAASGGDPLSAAESVEPLLLFLAGDAGAVILTITLPEVA